MKIHAVITAAAISLSACVSVQHDDREIEELPGAGMYQRLCSNCHGVEGTGHGPIAPLIKVGVPDLTRLAWRNGGEFPADDVHRTIDGRSERPAHGPRDMPVWGWQFYASADSNDEEERARVDAMISQLVDYLRSIQVE